MSYINWEYIQIDNETATRISIKQSKQVLQKYIIKRKNASTVVNMLDKMRKSSGPRIISISSAYGIILIRRLYESIGG